MEEDLVQEIEGRGLEGEINADPDQMKGDDVPHTREEDLGPEVVVYIAPIIVMIRP